MSDGDQGQDAAALSQTQEDIISPDIGPRGQISRGHQGEVEGEGGQGDHNDHFRPLGFDDEPAAKGRRGSPRPPCNAKDQSNFPRAGTVHEFELLAEVHIGGDESHAFAEKAKFRDPEIASLEEAMVEDAVLSIKDGVQGQDDHRAETDDQRGQDMGILPAIRVRRPTEGQGDAEKADSQK